MFRLHFLVSVNWEVNHKKFLIAHLGDVEGTGTALKEIKALKKKKGVIEMLALLES